MSPKLNYLSCAPDLLYRAGGFAESQACLEDLKAVRHAEVELIEELYPPYAYRHEPPAEIRSNDRLFLKRLAKRWSLAPETMEGAACALVRIAPAVLKWHVLYAMADGAWRIVYESHRPNSRPHTEPPLTAGALAKAARGPLKTGVIGLYFGSVGAANYGHWLIEELPRLKALAALRRRFPGRPVTVLLTRHSPQMNRVRREAIALALGDEAGVDIAWLDHKRAYSFEELYYASPVSYHPISKSPQALAWLVETLGPRIVPGSHTRIFVERRPEHGRGIVNVEAVRALLGSRGFKTIDPESMSFAEQAAAFAGARIAVGCSGAAMATAVFCPAGASVVHLAPDGWAESFYWDLAGRTGCRYIACHGPVLDAGSPPHRAPFEAPIDLLTKVLDAL